MPGGRRLRWVYGSGGWGFAVSVVRGSGFHRFPFPAVRRSAGRAAFPGGRRSSAISGMDRGVVAGLDGLDLCGFFYYLLFCSVVFIFSFIGIVPAVFKVVFG